MLLMIVSMTWLKGELRRLGLKRRRPDPPQNTVKTLIEVCMSVTKWVLM